MKRLKISRDKIDALADEICGSRRFVWNTWELSILPKGRLKLTLYDTVSKTYIKEEIVL